LQQKELMSNNFFKLGANAINEAAQWYANHGVNSIAIQAYETLMSRGQLNRLGYLRLMALYCQKRDIINANRISARYAKIYGI
jgi:two-component SAPR family response regulator